MSSRKMISCYLLESMNVSYAKHTYIGFTTNPLRRLRQHNGYNTSGGAKETSIKRPWRIVLVVRGFQSNLQALKFEWAWQHPRKSRFVKNLFQGARTKSGVLGQVMYLYELLSHPDWK